MYGWTFDEAWFDIGDDEQLLEADNCCARRAACRCARRTPRTDRRTICAKLSQTRDGFRRSVGSVDRRSPPAVAVRLVRRAPGRALRALSRRASAARAAAGARAAGRRRPGRSSAAASAPVGASRSPRLGRRSPTPAPCDRSCRAWKERGLRRLAPTWRGELVAATCSQPDRRGHRHVDPGRSGSAARAQPSSGRAARARARAALGARRTARCSAAAGRCSDRPGSPTRGRRANVQGAFAAVRAAPAHVAARRRRLHDRRDRRAPPPRRSARRGAQLGRGGHLRTGSSVTSEQGSNTPPRRRR